MLQFEILVKKKKTSKVQNKFGMDKTFPFLYIRTLGGHSNQYCWWWGGVVFFWRGRGEIYISYTWKQLQKLKGKAGQGQGREGERLQTIRNYSKWYAGIKNKTKKGESRQRKELQKRDKV